MRGDVIKVSKITMGLTVRTIFQEWKYQILVAIVLRSEEES